MELPNEDELKAQLMATSEEFRLLAQKHAELDRRVTALEGWEHLSESDQIEEVRLKKLKLSVKDLMNEKLHGVLTS